MRECEHSPLVPLVEVDAGLLRVHEGPLQSLVRCSGVAGELLIRIARDGDGSAGVVDSRAGHLLAAHHEVLPRHGARRSRRDAVDRVCHGADELELAPLASHVRDDDSHGVANVLEDAEERGERSAAGRRGERAGAGGGQRLTVDSSL